MKSEGVVTSVADQCVYGLETPSKTDTGSAPAKKPTRFISNSWCIPHELATRCDDSHVHQHLVGGRAAKAQEYPDKLCRAICRGLANQTRYDEGGKVCTGGVGINALMSLLSPVNVCGENHVKPPVGHVNIPHGANPEPSSGGSKTYLSSELSFPPHWVDSKHEPDGTARTFIGTGDKTTRSVGMLHSGVNDGAEALAREMSSLVEKYSGYVECWDDVSGAPLDVALLSAARKLEMFFV